MYCFFDRLILEGAKWKEIWRIFKNTNLIPVLAADRLLRVNPTLKPTVYVFPFNCPKPFRSFSVQRMTVVYALTVCGN